VVDDLLLLRQFLVAVSDLTDVVSTRIYAGRNTPIEGWQPSDGSCIAFKRRGGGQDESGRMLTTSFQFKCYGSGGSVSEQIINGNTVYRALRNALNYQTSYELLGAQEEGRGVTFGTPLGSEENHPYVLAFFRVQFRETTV